MLSVKAMTSGQENYYLQLAREDYYLEGGEPAGVWLGKGATELGLSGDVEGDDLRQLFAGFGPDGSPLVKNAGDSTRKPGWDMTVSVPKSVSVLWSASEQAQRAEIEAIVMGSAERLVGFVESDIAHTRKGSGGVDVQHAQLASAAFLHHTSRAQEPQLHVHLVTPNVGLGDDARWGALRSREDFYAHQRMLGAIFRADVAHEFARRGAELAQDRFAFKLKAVPDPLCEAQSTRRKQIEEHMAEQGTSGARAAEVANLVTRGVKGHAPREELAPAWQTLNDEHGFTVEKAARVLGQNSKQQEREPSLPFADTLEAVTANRSHFAERDFVRVLVEAVQAQGRDPYAVVKETREHLQSSRDIVHLGQERPYNRYTSRDLYQSEEQTLRRAESLQASTRHALSPSCLEKPSRVAGLSAEQREAVHQLVCEPGDIKCLTGAAGSGKTHTLAAARMAWKQGGYDVIGCACNSSAVKELEKGSGIKSRTVASTLYHVERTLTDEVKQNLSPTRMLEQMKQNLSPSEIAKHVSLDGLFSPKKQLIRNKPLQNKPLLAKPQVKLTENTVVVLDEASMLGTHDFGRLSAQVERAGAKLVCVGDNAQLSAIGPGGTFAALVDKHGHAQLTENRRQREPWMRQAAGQFRNGDADGALSLYATKGKLHVERRDDDAKQALVDAWSSSGTELKEKLILAGTNRDVDELNLAAQEVRRTKGELGRKSMLVDETRVHVGDRVLFTEISRLYGIANGDFATVEKLKRAQHPLDQGSLTVLLDTPGIGSPERVTVSLADYDPSKVRLGYASTTHKAQGTTVDRTFVLAGGWMQDRELTYVQMSRHREDCQVFASQAQVGEDLSELVRVMKQSHAQELAHTVQHRLTQGQAL